MLHWKHYFSCDGQLRVNHSAVTIGKTIFTVGGDYGDVELSLSKPFEIFALDTDKLKWWKLELHKDQDCGLVPSHRFGHTAVAQGSKIYLWGGRLEHDGCNNLYCFDIETSKWSMPNVGGNIPLTRDGHSACVINNCMYIFGGYEKNGNELSQDLYKLNLQTMMWSLVMTNGNVPSHRDFHTATAIGNKMYIFGGRTVFENSILPFFETYCCEIFYFDTETDTWICSPAIGNKPQSRRNHSAFVHKGSLYIFGGYNKNWGVRFQDINQYDPITSLWSTIVTTGSTIMSIKRQICQIVDDRVFICDDTYPINLESSILRMQEYYDLTGLIFDRPIDHNDLHILDLNFSLKNMCIANLWKFIDSKEICANQLMDLPPTLKNDMLVALPIYRNLPTL